jgi:hypothetical protein
MVKKKKNKYTKSNQEVSRSELQTEIIKGFKKHKFDKLRNPKEIE